MNWKNSPMLIAGETAAFGWFILRGLSFISLLPLIPMGYLYYRCMKERKGGFLVLNGWTFIASLLFCSSILSHGLFQGEGRLLLIALLIAAGLFGMNVPKREWMRVSSWWTAAFLVVFIGMLIATAFGVRPESEIPPFGEWWEILIFYLLAFGEPFSRGREYAAAPLALGILLIPFGVVSYYALGGGAFRMAQFPYLSVWSGVSLLAIHHIEGIILGFFYGMVAFRTVDFFRIIFERYCKPLGDVVE